MQEAVPRRTWMPIPQNTLPSPQLPLPKALKSVVSENPVVILGKRGCCMCHVAWRLLQSLGVNPTVYEVDEDDDRFLEELAMVAGVHVEDDPGRRLQFPAVFIGGRLFGGLERIMATHITGELVPILKQAGALWL
ncbi:Thioredoxin-disulfide reductase [Bertholletia excelsa]